MNAVRTSYSVEAQAIMTLGLITAIRAMLTELGQICHGASLVEVQLEQEEEEGDGTLMVQSRLVHWRATKSGPNENEQLPVEQEVMFLMQGAWVRSFGLVQRLQDDLEKAQPGVAQAEGSASSGPAFTEQRPVPDSSRAGPRLPG